MREYKYDNLKFLLIFCVVFGHCLELIQGKISSLLYLGIYTFTMPVFVYVSGYFAKCSKKNILRYTYLYAIFQIIYCVMDKNIYKLNINLLAPNWLLWYLFSLIIWTSLLKLFETKNHSKSLCLIIITFVISLLAGFFDFIGYKFSLSRIITFLPYFLLGYYTKKSNINILNLKRKDGIFDKKKIVIWSVIFIISIFYFWNIRGTLQARWLFGSFSYNNANYNYIFKFMWILLSLTELVVLDNFIINKKIAIVSKIGANTLYIYLMHGIMIKFFKNKINIFVYSEIINLILAAFITILIMIIFGFLITKENIIKKKY